MDKQLQEKVSDINIGIAGLSHLFKKLEQGEEVDTKTLNYYITTVFTDIAALLEEIVEAL